MLFSRAKLQAQLERSIFFSFTKVSLHLQAVAYLMHYGMAGSQAMIGSPVSRSSLLSGFLLKEKGRREELRASNSLQYNLDQDY